MWEIDCRETTRQAFIAPRGGDSGDVGEGGSNSCAKQEQDHTSDMIRRWNTAADMISWRDMDPNKGSSFTFQF